MPQAIVTFLVQLGVSAIVATVAAAIITVGIAVGLNALMKAVFGPKSPKPSDGQQNVNEAVGSRRRHYGIVCTGGQNSFTESGGGRLAIVVTLGTSRRNRDPGTRKINDASW